MDRWLADDLACLELQTVHTSNDGLRDIQKFTALTIGEPDGKLFQLPPNPHEVSPRVFFAPMLDAKSESPMEADDPLEQPYWRFKAIRGE